MALNPPSGIVKWYSTPLGERGWNTFRAQLTGKDYPGTSRKTSYVKLSDKEADEVIENIKKDSEGIPLFDEANAPDKAEEYQKWLVARYLTKPREEEFKNKTSKTSSEVNGGSSSVALAVVPKKEDDLVEEKIDSQIFSILGLEDVFDLTYEEYASLLKEASIKGRMANSQMSTESVELVTTELKRVKGKTGKFKVNPKKVDINKVFNRKTPSPSSAIVKSQKLLPPEQLQTEEAPVSSNLQEDLTNGIGNILESLITIRTVLQSQSKTEQKAAESDRKDTEKKKKKERESTLEKKKPQSPILKALTKPVDDFFGAIKRFFTNVLLGSVVLGLFRWLKDPKNKESIDKFTNFLENNAGLILGGLLAIASLPLATTLLSFTASIISGIGMLGTALGGLTTLLPAFGLLSAFVGGQMIFKNLQKFVGGEDAASVHSELYNLRKDLQLRKAQSLLMSENEKEIALKKIEEDEKKLDRIEQELLPRMTKTQSMKRENEKLKKEIEQQQKRLKDIKDGKVVFPLASQKQQTIDKINQAIISKREKILQNEKNIPISQKIQEDLMKDIMGPAGAQGDIIDKIDKFVKDAQKMVENLNTGVQPQTSLAPGSPNIRSGPDPNATYRKPNKSKFSSFFGSKESFRKKAHEGIDDPIPVGTELSFNQSGKILDVYRTSSTSRDAGGGYGQFVKVQLDDGKVLLMAHLSEISSWVKNGAKFNANDLIAKSGGAVGAPGSGRSGGPHLHFEQHNTPGLGLEETLRGKVDPIQGGGIAALQYGGVKKTGKIEMDSSSETPLSRGQIARTPAPTPSIPSPTGRGNIVPLPIPTGGGAQQASSGTSPNQAPVPRFSSEDPNNTTTMVVRAIYNIVG